MLPIVHWLEDEYWGQVDFIYLNQYDNDNREVFDEYGLRGRPIFLLLEPDGTEVRRWFGAVDEDDLRGAIDDYLASQG